MGNPVGLSIEATASNFLLVVVRSTVFLEGEESVLGTVEDCGGGVDGTVY